MKYAYFHRNCWKKIAYNDRSHAMDISRITKVILKNCPKNWKNDSLSRKNGIFKNKYQKSSFSYGTRFSQPKYHIPRWKIVTGSLKPKNYECYIRNSFFKNPIKSVKMTHLTVKNWIFKKIQKSSIFYGTRFTQPKYYNPRWKTVTRSLKPKIY